MHRAGAFHFTIATLLVLGGCGLKTAGSTAPAARGGQGGGGGAAGGGGAGGTGGSGGSGGSSGTGGSGPIIITLDGGFDGPHSMPDANCGARDKSAMKVVPDILIVLDRSGSMDNDVNDKSCVDGGFGIGMCGANSKWALITPAISQVVSDTEMDVNWGLKFFPDNAAGVCSVSSTAAVDVGPGNAAAIATAIMGATNTAGGVIGYNGTPTRAAEAGAATYLSGLTDMSKRYILLATDGQPTCVNNTSAQGDDSPAAITAVGDANTAGFPTFVVGIATGGMSTADMTLSKMADAGGLPRSAMPSYYPVSSAADLAAAIRTLIGVAASCTFQIGPPPSSDGTTSLDMINVFGDGTEIMRDPSHTNGYDYTDDSKMSIQIYGPLCDQVMSGAIHDVSVTFICIVL
ncbi:MAG TPA: vWA domain-containing protein [Polyangia bacterium]|jgi:hypothetical protein